MSHLNSARVIAARPLSNGRLQQKLEFQESSPDIPKPPSLFIDELDPPPVKNPNAGPESLSGAMACLRGEC